MENREKALIGKSIISILFGVTILLFFSEMISLIVLFLAIYLLVDGILEISNGVFTGSRIHKFVAGFISIVVGVLLLINPTFIQSIFIYIVATKFIIEGCVHLANEYQTFKTTKEINWMLFLKNIAIILVSIWLIASPFTSFATLMKIIAVYALFTGVVHIVESRKAITLLIKDFSIKELLNSLKPYLYSGLGYGAGFLIGTILISIILGLDEGLVFELYDGNQRNLLAITSLILIIILHGVIVGGIGSLLITKWNDNVTNKKDFILANMLGSSIAGALLIIPIILFTVLAAFASAGNVPITQIIILFTLFGTFYGIISSSIIVHKHALKVRGFSIISYMTIGYAIGGALLGITVWQYFFNQSVNIDHQAGFGWILLGLFLFGFVSGISTLMSINVTQSAEVSLRAYKERETILDSFFSSITSSSWFRGHSIKNFIGLVILIFIVTTAVALFFLNKPDLDDQLTLQTQGTNWIVSEEKLTIFQNEEISIDNPNIEVICNEDELQVLSEKISHTYRLNCNEKIAPLIFRINESEYKIIWSSNEITNIFGEDVNLEVIYSADLNEETYTQPVIVAQTNSIVKLEGTQYIDNNIGINWTEENTPQTDFFAYNQKYTCDNKSDSELVNNILVQAQSFFPEIDYPSCGNRFDLLLYTPNPDPNFSDDEARENSAYDYLKDLISTTQYEADITNMWYDKDNNLDSPGNYIALGVAELYEKVKSNPENYPRGVSVKILLGNPPQLLVDQTEAQIWSVLNDLRTAGVDKMIDKNIGWEVEVANFDGALPHSHTKMVVVDGKTVIGAGFNVQYDHYPLAHISGLGDDRVDNGIQVTGPVAQHSLATFDQLWDGANKMHCSDFYPKPEDSWRLTCTKDSAIVKHVPEVLQFYIAKENDSSSYLSLARNLNYKESDVVFADAISQSKESLDIIQVNFSLNMICDLNIIFEVCDVHDSPDYMQSLLEALNNGSKVRVLTKEEPIDGLENKVAIKQLMKYAKENNLEDLIEIKYFDGAFHSKVVQIDNEIVFIGSQNFHYSAWGDGGLTEFNIATNDDSANDEIKKFFDYHWDKGNEIDL